MIPDTYSQWLTDEIERLQAHYSEVDVPGNERYAGSVITQYQTLQRARGKYTQLIKNQPDTDPDNENSFTNGLT